MPSAVLAGGLAQRGGVAFDVEQVVGDLKGFTDRRAVARDGGSGRGVCLAENRTGAAGKAQQRAGLHCLQGDDLAFAQRAFLRKAPFGGKV